jgi:L-threonylcarbamoyladenylate synthase
MSILTLKEAVKCLKMSQIVAFPTETVYGLGAIATDPEAIEKVFVAKSSLKDRPLICHFYDIKQVHEYVTFPAPYIQELFRYFSPGPISFLLPLKNGRNSPLKYAVSGSDKVICRIPRHTLTLDLIKECGLPLVGPSANLSGRSSGTSAQMVLDQLGDKIAGVLDGGESEIGIESTIIDCTQKDKVIILRPGAIGMFELKAALQDFKIQIIEKVNTVSEIKIPVNKYPHYSPKTPVIHIQNLDTAKKIDQQILIISSDEKIFEIRLWQNTHQNFQTLSLGSKFRLSDVAKHLYQNLMKVDSMGFDKAYLLDEDWGSESLGVAIENRLKKVGVS